jgi:hypothetical protein
VVATELRWVEEREYENQVEEEIFASSRSTGASTRTDGLVGARARARARASNNTASARHQEPQVSPPPAHLHQSRQGADTADTADTSDASTTGPHGQGPVVCPAPHADAVIQRPLSDVCTLVPPSPSTLQGQAPVPIYSNKHDRIFNHID